MKLGERQTLTIDRFREFGAYLTDGTQSVPRRPATRLRYSCIRILRTA